MRITPFKGYCVTTDHMPSYQFQFIGIRSQDLQRIFILSFFIAYRAGAVCPEFFGKINTAFSVTPFDNQNLTAYLFDPNRF